MATLSELNNENNSKLEDVHATTKREQWLNLVQCITNVISMKNKHLVENLLQLEENAKLLFGEVLITLVNS